MRMDHLEYKGPRPRLRVDCSRREKVRLFELLGSTGRLALFGPSDVTPAFGSGLFAVLKDSKRDRLIMDSSGPTF